VVAAGIGNYAALFFVVRKGGDFVVGSAEFEGADRLLVFGLEEEAAGGVAMIEFDQPGADGDAIEAGTGLIDVGKSNH
jgi:hypothetical protein